MRISQLRCFVTIARLENMSQAAELLHLSQSSLSKNIATLEEELGVQLFQRNGRSLSLNPAGERLLEYSTMVLRELDYAKEDMKLLSLENESRIRIGTAGFYDDLSKCLSAFKEKEEDVQFDITANIEDLEYLDIKDYDMLIYPDTHKYEKFKGIPLYEEKYLLAVPAKHELAANIYIRAEALNGEDVIFIHNGRANEEHAYHICDALALDFASLSYADNREMQKQMIAAGLGVGFVPASCASSYKDNRIHLIPIQDKRFNRQMMICFRKEKHLSPLAQKFKEHVYGYYELEKDPDPLETVKDR